MGTAPPPLSREEVDQVLIGLGAAYDRIAAGMYALDSHAGLAFLRGGTVRGSTARAAREVLARTEVLWAQFSAFRELLERARTVRAERSRPAPDELAELTGLLRAPAVPVDDGGLPLDEAAAGPPAARLTLAGLGRRLESEHREVLETLDRVDGACSRLAARLSPLAETLTAARSTAQELDAGREVADIGRLAAELSRATDDALGDPLAADARTGDLDARLARLAADLDAAAARLAELSRLREAYPSRIEALRAAIDEVAAGEVQVGQAYDAALAKIADSGLPPAPAEAAALRDRLAGLERWLRDGGWQRLAQELAALEQAAAEARERARQLRQAADGLLARRAELRGRLDAYRAKAARFGLVEHEGLSARHRQAQELLYTSPCDLPAATRAVFGYQQALAELIGQTAPQPRETP